jgi:hypothetical protein
MLSHKCTSEVNAYLEGGKTDIDETKMFICFVQNASKSHSVCTREFRLFGEGKTTLDHVKKCARKEFGLAIRNLIQTSIAVGECRPIP